MSSPKITPPAALPAISNPVPIPEPNSPAAVEARKRASRMAKSRNGRQSTILTSPTGLETTSSIGSTLLGS